MTISIEQLRQLAALQAEDGDLWHINASIETHYVQQALRIITQAIDGDITFEHAREAITEMHG